MDRRSLLDDEPAPMDGVSNVFDDQFEVDDFDFVADGFRPSAQDAEDAADGERQDEGLTHGDEPVRSISAHYAPDSVSSPPVSRNVTRSSISKPQSHQDNPFASPEDDGAPSLSFEPSHSAHRSVSSASSHQFARSNSPRFGAGPSHPYGMYQQDTMSRSASVATSSTIRPLNPPPSGPQHPYNLYPQTVMDDIEDEADATRNAVPVGFSGLGQSYHRQLGPDGEEQDIIGEDGHAEQLPPYSRYPEDGPEKIPLLVPAPPVALHSRAPVAGTDPTMPLMHTTLVPTPSQQSPQPDREPESMTDASTLARHTSVSSAERRAGLAGSTSSINSRKSWSEKSWREKRKTKFCGMPFWLLLLVLGIIVFISTVLGGVIGGFRAGVHKTQVTPPSRTTPLYDASTIPTRFAPPPTGTYQLSLSTPQATQADCLPRNHQQQAWSCDLGGVPAVAINIAQDGNKTGAYLTYASNNTQIYYGTQTSWMTTDSFAPFLTVIDNDNPELGAAYFFQQFYNKLVVLPEAAFSTSYNSNNVPNKVRDIHLDDSWFQQRQVVRPSEQPWFCVWNNTFVEGFIYMQQNVAATVSNSTNSSTATPTSSGASGTTASSAPITPAPTIAPDATITSALTRATITTTYTGAMSYYPAWSSKFDARHSGPYKGNDGEDDDDMYNHHGKRQSPTAAPGDLYNSLQPFPYMVKVEERRLANNPRRLTASNIGCSTTANSSP